MKGLFRNILLALVIVPVMGSLWSCGTKEDFDIRRHPEKNSSSAGTGGRDYDQWGRRVMLLYSAGLNSLTHYLSEDINDLMNGYVPGNRSNDNVLLVFSRNGAYSSYGCKAVSPVLFRMYKDQTGATVRDTLVTYPVETNAASAATVTMVLEDVRSRFPSYSYGMVFSSHASGWVPPYYYFNPSAYDPEYIDSESGGGGVWGTSPRRAHPVFDPNEMYPDLPPVKSVGQDYLTGGAVEMSLRDFADAIPYKLEYLLFDACLMGGIETAYELRDKTDIVGFSQAEVLAEGFDYTTLAAHLIGSAKADPKAVCEDYFNYYDQQSGVARSATISLIDCTKLEPLATLCREYFEKYRSAILSIDASTVQVYFRFGRHFFYDLEDILLKAGITTAEQAALERALLNCTIYKAATPSFMQTGMSGFDIFMYSGFSMFLPAAGTTYITNYYKSNLDWNDATLLVK